MGKKGKERRVLYEFYDLNALGELGRNGVMMGLLLGPLVWGIQMTSGASESWRGILEQEQKLEINKEFSANSSLI